MLEALIGAIVGAVLTAPLSAWVTVAYVQRKERERKAAESLEAAAAQLIGVLVALHDQVQRLDGDSGLAVRRYQELQAALGQRLDELVHTAVPANRTQWAIELLNYLGPLTLVVPFQGERWFLPGLERIAATYPRLRPLINAGTDAEALWNDIERHQGHPPVTLESGFNARGLAQQKQLQAERARRESAAVPPHDTDPTE